MKFSSAIAFFLALFTWVVADEKPNIVLIFTDDQGWNDVGCYGSEIPTPHIDRIAGEGIRFDQFYAASSICTPSRFGLLTGRNPSRSQHGLLSALMFMADEHRTTGIQPGETTIAEVLREEAGYDTALIGKWHLGHGNESLLPLNHGFETFIGHTGGCIDFFTMTYGIIPDWYHGNRHVSENGYATELITDEAVKYLENRSEKRDDPFFLYLAYNAPHFGKGYSPADGRPVNIMQPQADDLKRVAFIDDKIRREFGAMTVNLDDGVGRVLQTLDDTGLAGNTLVIFLTDHGGDPTYGGSNRPWRGNKAELFEGGLRVPCVMRWPGRLKAGRTIDSPCWAIDLFPTFLELAGLKSDRPPIDGVSLVPVLGSGAEPPADREFFWETGAHSELGRRQWRALRVGDLKYVQSPSEGEFLFDLAKDPGESSDLKESRRADFQRLKERWMTLASDYRE